MARASHGRRLPGASWWACRTDRSSFSALGHHATHLSLRVSTPVSGAACQACSVYRCKQVARQRQRGAHPKDESTAPRERYFQDWKHRTGGALVLDTACPTDCAKDGLFHIIRGDVLWAKLAPQKPRCGDFTILPLVPIRHGRSCFISHPRQHALACHLHDNTRMITMEHP